jgi:hypothetical protein
MGSHPVFTKAQESIKAAKNKFRASQNIRQAKKLQTLREQRIYKEGKAKLSILERKERQRIEKAEAHIKGHSGKKGKGTLMNVKKATEKGNPYALGNGPVFGGKGPDWGLSTGTSPQWGKVTGKPQLGSASGKKKKNQYSWFG